MAITDGGAAFPRVVPLNIDRKYEAGMSLRDYIAAKAMQGLISDRETLRIIGRAADIARKDGDEMIAIRAYNIADAMLEARFKNNE